MDVVAVSERLGHWSPTLTLSTYAHAMWGRQGELAKAIGAALKIGEWFSGMILTCDRDGARRHEHILAGSRANGAVAQSVRAGDS